MWSIQTQKNMNDKSKESKSCPTSTSHSPRSLSSCYSVDLYCQHFLYTTRLLHWSLLEAVAVVVVGVVVVAAVVSSSRPHGSTPMPALWLGRFGVRAQSAYLCHQSQIDRSWYDTSRRFHLIPADSLQIPYARTIQNSLQCQGSGSWRSSDLTCANLGKWKLTRTLDVGRPRINKEWGDVFQRVVTRLDVSLFLSVASASRFDMH